MSIKTVAEAIPGLLAYGERHFQRLDRLHQATYVLEYMSSLMHLLPLEEDDPVSASSASKLTNVAPGAVVAADKTALKRPNKREIIEEDEDVPVLFAPIADENKSSTKTKKRRVDA
jgi:hypothetical protein